MPVPLAATAVAAAAGAAYLNARAFVGYDSRLIASITPPALALFWRERRGTLNAFRDFEDLAKSKSAAARPFLLFEDKRYTYAQAYDIVLRYGHWLKTRWGVHKGEVIALDFQNTDTFVFLWLGLWSIGAQPAFLNYNLSGRALIHCVGKAKSRLMFIDPVVAGNVGDDVRRELGKAVHFEIFDAQLEAEVLRTEPVRHPDELRVVQNGLDMAILIYTSGTTGLPKAAIVSWAKLYILAGFGSRFLGLKTSDVYYTSMPLYHSTATLMSFGPVLHAGATLAMGRKFSTSRFWHDVHRHDASTIQYVGEACRYLVNAPPSRDPATGENLDRAHRVRVAYGNGLRPDVWDRFKERFGIDTIVEFYGATEGMMLMLNRSRNGFGAGAVGRGGWLYHVAMGSGRGYLEIDHVTDTPVRDARTGLCRAAAPGQTGELVFRLPERDVESRFQGYYGDPAATSSKVLRDVFRRGDVWFRTGDLLREDAEGRVFFSDRIGDTFRWKSENVATAEVAQAVGLFAPVREANVYGVALPHHEGRAGCVALVLDPAAAAPDRLDATLRGLAAHVRRALPRFALPLFLRLLPETGANATGTNKQQKHVLRQQGVVPGRVGPHALYWLRGDTYVPFGDKDWEELSSGRAKL